MIYADGEWPEDTTMTRADRTVFGGRPLLRKLRVLIDDHLFKLPVHGEAIGPEQILSGLVMHPYISYHRYADGEPPTDTGGGGFPESGLACEGWAIVDPPDEPWDTRGVAYFEAGNPVTGIAYVEPLNYARNDMRAYPVGFQKSATAAEQGLHATRSYSLIKPPRTGRHLIRS
jgi:hypothetical protein